MCYKSTSLTILFLITNKKGRNLVTILILELYLYFVVAKICKFLSVEE